MIPLTLKKGGTLTRYEFADVAAAEVFLKFNLCDEHGLRGDMSFRYDGYRVYDIEAPASEMKLVPVNYSDPLPEIPPAWL